MAPKLIQLIRQLVFGVDTLIGLGCYIVFSFAFQQPLNLWCLLFAGFFAYAPDFDILYFKFQSYEKRKWGHWRLGFHHPILALPTVFLLVWLGTEWFFHAYRTYLMCMALMGVFLHFVHDMQCTLGFHWFSPFTVDGRVSFKDPRDWAHCQFLMYGSLFRRVPESELAHEYDREARMAREGGTEEITGRLDSFASAQYVAFVVCLLAMGLLVFLNGYRFPLHL